MIKFASLGSILTRDELKSIKGGVYCEIYYEGQVFGGHCSGGTVSECNEYAQANCYALQYSGGTSPCSHACW